MPDPISHETKPLPSAGDILARLRAARGQPEPTTEPASTDSAADENQDGRDGSLVHDPAIGEEEPTENPLRDSDSQGRDGSLSMSSSFKERYKNNEPSRLNNEPSRGHLAHGGEHAEEDGLLASERMENAAAPSIGEQVAAEMRAEHDAPITSYAEQFVPPLALMQEPHWQLFDNTAEIERTNAAHVAADNRYRSGQRAGQFITSNQSHWTLKLGFKMKAGSTHWHWRYVNFQDPRRFRGQVSVWRIDADYHDDMYERTRLDLIAGNEVRRAQHQPLDLIGHMERDHRSHRRINKERKDKSQRGGSPRLPYNFAVLLWTAADPVVIVTSGYNQHLLTLRPKIGRTPDSAQYELYGL